MAVEKCPECGASVKADNLRRHLRNVHPGVDPDRVMTAEQQEATRQARRSPAGRPLRRSPVLWGAVVVLVVAGAVVGAPHLLAIGNGGLNIVTTCGQEGSAEHYHPLLIINSNGVHQFLPADSSQPGDIGYIPQPEYTNPSYYCPAGESHVLHTHDGSGIIHVELPQTVSGEPTLGEFFQIWGQPLGTGAVWTFTGRVTAAMYDSDLGVTRDYSGDPGSIPLYPSPQGPSANPYPIPPSLIDNGSHGTGESSGHFSGEIIWLNVTA